MNRLRIVLFCLGSAMAYGILHDQVTARISVEYFTIGHPVIIATQSPTLLGLLWGILGTVAGGLLVGFLLAHFAAGGTRPAYPVARLQRTLGLLLCSMAVGSLISGLVGQALHQQGWIMLPQTFAALIPPERHSRFMSVWWAHGGSYFVAYVGAVLIAWRISKARNIQHIRSLQLE